MSWQGESYIDNWQGRVHPQHDAIDILDVGLLRSGKITQAAIVGQDGEVWAESAGCNVCIISFPPPSPSRVALETDV